MSILAIVGLSTIVAFWCLLFGGIIVANVGNRARRRAAHGHSLSWVEFVPVLIIAIAATIILNQWRPELGYLVVGCVHATIVIVIVALWMRQKSRRYRSGTIR